MRTGVKLIGLVIAASGVLAACSTGGAAPSASLAASAEPPASGASSDAPSPSASSAAASPSAGGGTATGACALLTPEEVGAVVGVAVDAVASGEASCVYEVASTRAVVVYTQHIATGGAAQFGALKTDPAAVTVDGLGDEALWLPAQEAVQLHTVTGDQVLTLALGTLSGVPIDELPTGTSPEVLLEKAKQLATLAVSRL